MASEDTMIHWLATYLREQRDELRPRPSQGDIVAYVPGRDGPINTSAVTRFENHEEWPTNPDAFVAAYALHMGTDPRDIWLAVATLLREKGQRPPRAERVPTRAERAERLAREAGQSRRPRSDESPGKPTSTRRHRSG